MSRGADWPFLAGAAVAGRAELRGRGQGSGVADRGSGRRALTPVPLGASLFRCRGWRVRDLLSGIPGTRGVARIMAGVTGGADVVSVGHPFAALGPQVGRGFA